jgi:hypothetical protein
MYRMKLFVALAAAAAFASVAVVAGGAATVGMKVAIAKSGGVSCSGSDAYSTRQEAPAWSS